MGKTDEKTNGISLGQMKQNYYAHLKGLNPDLEGTYRSSVQYYDAEILPLLPPNRGARILDVGCGFGHLIRFLIEMGFENTGGIELDSLLFDTCQRHIGHLATFLVNDDVTSYLLDMDDEFDLIVCTDVIEHFTIEDTLFLAGNFLSALKPRGRLILRTPNMANLFGIYSRYMDITHKSGFTEQSLIQLLRQAGFNNPQLHLPDWREHPYSRRFQWSSRLQQWLFRLQDRSMPRCFDKNIVMWADKV